MTRIDDLAGKAVLITGNIAHVNGGLSLP